MGEGFWLFFVFVALLGIRGYYRFPAVRISLFAGLGLAIIILVLAAWLGGRGYFSLAIGIYLVASGIAWVSYSRAEVETEQDEIRKAQAYLAGNKHWVADA